MSYPSYYFSYVSRTIFQESNVLRNHVVQTVRIITDYSNFSSQIIDHGQLDTASLSTHYVNVFFTLAAFSLLRELRRGIFSPFSIHAPRMGSSISSFGSQPYVVPFSAARIVLLPSALAQRVMAYHMKESMLTVCYCMSWFRVGIEGVAIRDCEFEVLDNGEEEGGHVIPFAELHLFACCL